MKKKIIGFVYAILITAIIVLIIVPAFAFMMISLFDKTHLPYYGCCLTYVVVTFVA